MLTRSKTETGAKSSDIKPPTLARRRGRSKSKSVQKKKMRNQSRSSNKTIPRLINTQTNSHEKMGKETEKKSIEYVDSKLRKSPTSVNRSSSLGDKTNNDVKLVMLTRSRKETGANSSDIKPPTLARRRGRSKSKSVQKKKMRNRSRSSNKTIPRLIITRTNSLEKMVKEIEKKSIEHVDSKLRKSPTPVNRSSSLGDKTNNDVKVCNLQKRKSVNKSSLSGNKTNNDVQASSANCSKLYYDNGSDYESFLVKNTRATVLSAEFLESFGNILLTLLMPILVIVAKIALKAKGILIPFPQEYLRFANYYDQDVFLWTTAIVTFQLLISLLPLFKKSKGIQNDDSNPIYYRFSGPVNLILIVGALIIDVTNYYKLPLNFIQEILTKKSVPHIVASVLCAFIISIALFIKSKSTSIQNVRKQNTNSLNVVQKLFIGTTSNPTLGTINIKLALYRYSLLMTILFNYVVIMDSLKNSINIHLYVVVGFQILYAIDKLFFEFNLLSSFYLQKEKDGYWTLIQPFLQPAINFLPIQVLHMNNLPVNHIILSISSIIFLVGLICERYSAFSKYQYENNANYAGGKKVNRGLGTFVNYPNYLSTIIVHLAVILPAFMPSIDSLQASWPIFLYPLYYIITVSHRCICDSTYYRLHYGFVLESE